ncbi:hypothetical protein [Methylobacterium isbiliense]|uniref:Uncharacterized protein n=1 Tax=Methylobacterium isbiliense TaxID=315478 RepID=A0ABQ4SNH4_9HYPH|nr:hypothetical protein [Methylobacterium isbiliense]MDN3627552.1 hypothetical protein [Methylobacterium isbiliense]GJE03333.1 hypothetical protein GMJLKIPL_5287 [Methylobacterium isbiliense]
MKTLIATSTVLMLLSAAPSLAMSCCSGGKGKMMCGKGSMAMNHAGMRGKKGGCCCEGMSGNMSRRS